MDIIPRVKDLVGRRYPELADVEPAVAVLDNGSQVVTFRKALATPDGATIRRVVRVTVDAQGNVLKVNESRG
jgi:hypothetical protein